MRAILFTLLFCLYLPTLALAASWQNVFTTIGQPQGLPHNSVRDVLFAKDGLVWFATLGGLARFDGYRVEVFKHQADNANSPPSNNIHALWQDNRERIWFATGGTVAFYDVSKGEFSRPTAPAQGCDIAIRQLTGDGEGNLWGSNDSGNLYHYNSETATSSCVSVQHLGVGQAYLAIYGLAYDKQSKGIWLATAKGLAFYDIIKQRSHFISAAQGNFNHSLIAIQLDNKGHVWAGGVGTGIFEYHPRSGLLVRYLPEQYPLLKGLTFTSFAQDNSGRTWMSTNSDGALILEQGTFKRFRGVDFTSGRVPQKVVFRVKKDPSGNLWILGTVNGVNIIPSPSNGVSGLSFKAIAHNNSQRSFNSLFVDEQGAVVMGTTNGLFRLAPNGEINRLDHAALGEHGFWHGAVADEGSHYICSSTDLYRFDDNKKFTSLAKGQGIRWCSDYWAQDESTMWITTQSVGLVKFDKNSGQFDFVSQRSGDSLAQFSNSLMALHFSPALGLQDKGKLWLASLDKGFGYLDLNTNGFTSYQHQPNNSNSLPGNVVNDIVEDAQGMLWLATFSGLSRFDPANETFTNFGVKDGLSNEQLNKILIDDDGDLWVSSQNGLNLINPKTLSISAYYREDGLFDNEFNIGPATKGKDGRLYFGGVEGLTMVEPNKFKQYSAPIRPFISAIKAYKQKAPLPQSQHLVFNVTPKRLSFYFGSTAYAHLKTNQFRYRLLGLEQDWQSVDKSTFVDYSNLPYGDYTFELQVKTQSGQWSAAVASKTLTIVTPWYLTAWALITYMWLLLVLISMVVKWSVQAEKRKAQFLQQQVNEQTASLSQKNSQIGHLLTQQRRLFVQLSHEIRTPLTLIFAPLQRMFRQQENKTQYQQLFDVAHFNQNRLVTMLDQLLDIAQSSQLQEVEQQAVSVTDAVNWVGMAMQPLFDQKQQQLKVALAQPANIKVSTDALEKILLNLLVNAHKYTPQGGQILLEGKACDKLVYIGVSDNGPGIAVEQQARIFDVFERASGRSDLPGAGVGLALAKQLVEINGGTIALESSPGQGSCFSLKFPRFGGEVATDYIAPAFNPEQSAPVSNENSSLDDQSLPSILVVEDHPQMRQYLKSCLVEKYRVLLANDGKAGFDCAIEQVPDIIISDIMMPKMDGYELLSAVKNHPNTDHVPVILLTAQSDQRSRLEGFNRRADDYINKPFVELELLLKIQNLLHLRAMWHKSFERQRSDNLPDDSAIVMQLNPVQQKLVDRLNELCGQNYQNGEFGLDDIADEMAMGKRQLQRKVKALTGLTPIAVLNDIRLNKARELIEQGEQITQVAYSCGFNKYDNFSKAFKDKFGASPKNYLVGMSANS